MANLYVCTSDDPTNHQGDTCPIHELEPLDRALAELEAAEAAIDAALAELVRNLETLTDITKGVAHA